MAYLLASSDVLRLQEIPDIIDDLVSFFRDTPAEDFTEGEIPSSKLKGYFGKTEGTLPLMMTAKSERSLRNSLGKFHPFVDAAIAGWNFSSALLVVGKVLITIHTRLNLASVTSQHKDEAEQAMEDLAKVWGGERMTGEAGMIHLYHNKTNEAAKNDLIQRLSQTRQALDPIVQVSHMPVEGIPVHAPD